MAIEYIVENGPGNGDVIIQNPGKPIKLPSIYDPRYNPRTTIIPNGEPRKEEPVIIPNYIPVIPGEPQKKEPEEPLVNRLS